MGNGSSFKIDPKRLRGFPDGTLILKAPTLGGSAKLHYADSANIINITFADPDGGDHTVGYLDAQQVWTAAQTFASSALKIYNPAQTFNYILVGSAITGNRNLTLPLITGADTLAVLGLAQTFTGAKIFSGLATLNGGVVLKRTATAISYTALSTDAIIAVTSTAATRTITLPAAVTGQVYVVKDESGGAAAKNITIAPNGAETIDGAATIAIAANYGVSRLYGVAGTGWFTI